MLAAASAGRCRIGLHDVPDPASAADEALVRVVAVGLCGTDPAHVGPGERGGGCFPLRQGHAIGAVVEQLPVDGSGRHLSAGDVVDPSFPCGRCQVCRRGEWPSGATFSAYGVARAGGLAKAMAVPAATCTTSKGCPPKPPLWWSRSP